VIHGLQKLYNNHIVTFRHRNKTARTLNFQNAFSGIRRKTTASTSDAVLFNNPLHTDADQKLQIIQAKPETFVSADTKTSTY